ncbi:unnamed protein product, partial [Nesidiocoris tenuis]
NYLRVGRIKKRNHLLCLLLSLLLSLGHALADTCTLSDWELLGSRVGETRCRGGETRLRFKRRGGRTNCGGSSSAGRSEIALPAPRRMTSPRMRRAISLVYWAEARPPSLQLRVKKGRLQSDLARSLRSELPQSV